MAGGFEGMPAIKAVAGAYLGLTGSGDGGKEQAVEDLANEVAEHMARLDALIAAYDRPEQAYTSHGRPMLTTDEGDYDHLARRGEWGVGGNG